MVIAFPPCTYITNAGACRTYPKKGEIDLERYKKGLAAVDFFLNFYYADVKKICIENPRPMRVFNMPPCSQIVQPFMFGHPYTKETHLWLKGLPILMATDLVIVEQTFLPSGTSRKKPDSKGAAKRGNDAVNRSKTFSGLAQAMACQWG